MCKIRIMLTFLLLTIEWYEGVIKQEIYLRIFSFNSQKFLNKQKFWFWLIILIKHIIIKKLF